MNAYDLEKWGVHVLGPDNIYAAESFDDAVKKCNEINSEIIKDVKSVIDENGPLLWAQVVKWNDVADHEHVPVNECWNYII